MAWSTWYCTSRLARTSGSGCSARARTRRRGGLLAIQIQTRIATLVVIASTRPISAGQATRRRRSGHALECDYGAPEHVTNVWLPRWLRATHPRRAQRVVSKTKRVQGAVFLRAW